MLEIELLLAVSDRSTSKNDIRDGTFFVAAAS
jgi:hypothetical protein